MHARARAHTHTHTHTTHTHIHTHARTHARTRARARTHTHTHTHITLGAGGHALTPVFWISDPSASSTRSVGDVKVVHPSDLLFAVSNSTTETQKSQRINAVSSWDCGTNITGLGGWGWGGGGGARQTDRQADRQTQSIDQLHLLFWIPFVH